MGGPYPRMTLSDFSILGDILEFHLPNHSMIDIVPLIIAFNLEECRKDRDFAVLSCHSLRLTWIKGLPRPHLL